MIEEAGPTARDLAEEEAIPDDWQEYLATYAFPHSDVAEALSRTLKEPQEAHPIWFCEAILAVKRAKLDLETLTYKAIWDAIQKWREKRFARPNHCW